MRARGSIASASWTASSLVDMPASSAAAAIAGRRLSSLAAIKGAAIHAWR